MRRLRIDNHRTLVCAAGRCKGTWAAACAGKTCRRGSGASMNKAPQRNIVPAREFCKVVEVQDAVMAVATGKRKLAPAPLAPAPLRGRATYNPRRHVRRGRASRSSRSAAAPLWPAAAPGLQAAGRASALVRTTATAPTGHRTTASSPITATPAGRSPYL